MQTLGNGYIVVAELPVTWLPAASQIPPEGKAAMYPVWLMDSTGTRAAVFMRCPACDTPLGISPGSAGEQKSWNRDVPDVHMMLGCGNCPALYLLRNEVAYCLSMLPPQQEKRTVPRPLVADDTVPVG